MAEAFVVPPVLATLSTLTLNLFQAIVNLN